MTYLIVRIYGQVQGIGFRYVAGQEAHKLGVTCSARNEPDGSVYIEAEGDEEKLGKFLKWCGKGPWLAKVDRVESEWSQPV